MDLGLAAAAAADYRAVTATKRGAKTTASETAADITVRSGALTVVFSKQTGQLVSVRRGAQTLSLSNGPRLAVGEATLTKIEQHAEGADTVVNATYTGNMKVRPLAYSEQWLAATGL